MGAACGLSLALAMTAEAVAVQDAPAPPASKAQRLTFDVMDRNADRKISAEEFRNAMAAAFEVQDRNLDGTVTRREVELSGPRALAAFNEAGGRATGKLSLPAFLEFAISVFDGIDTNADGFVTLEESQAAVAKVKAARAAK
jgi:Ca2+-binding EF-hand superfamily protein